MPPSATATAVHPSDQAPGRLVLVRHGATEWSRSGRHTGRTDIPLLPQGEQDAYAVGRALAGRPFGAVRSSPLQRARRTAALAGFPPTLDPDLVEWDYGGYEGLTSAQIRADIGADWTVFTHGVPPSGRPDGTPGETLAEVAARAARVLQRVVPVLEEQDVLLVAHGHLLRVLASVFLGWPPATGANLLLDAGSISVLEMEKEVPAIRAWNTRPERTAYDAL